MVNDVNPDGRKTEQAHWDSAWSSSVRTRLPSRLNVGILNVTRLVAHYVKPGDRYIEVGCAPGKLLAWVSKVLKADVAGLDYSEVGIAQCRSLFNALKLDVDLFHEDLFNHQLQVGAFDVVCSFGVIEHFDDAAPVVKKHLDLVKSGGVAVITVPNYGGIYGDIQKWCDEPNLKLHNVTIMHTTALTGLVHLSADIESVKAYPFGSIDPWILNLDKRIPRFLARLLSLSMNAIGILQPVTIKTLAPMLVLEIRKK
jgi:2-polyprenyl-3-methyl-5-hydroxy-6-metoxy-1,4-benzoquinol methylase